MISGKRALTLSEVLLSLGLLAMVSLSMMGAFVGGNRLIERSADLSTATDVSRAFLEQVKAGGYERTAVGIFDGFVPTDTDADTEFPPFPYPLVRRNKGDYTLVVTCEQHSVTTRLVKVSVYYDRDSHTEIGTLIHR